MTHEAGNWDLVRRQVLTRDGNTCVDCGISEELHVHHLIPRSAGGPDVPSNMVTLCAGCHAGKHLNLQASLGRRFLERWAWRLAHWLDRQLVMADDGALLGAVMRLFKIDRLRPGQLEVILAAKRGESILFVSPTGSGKSFCFHAPTLMQTGMAIVVSPLKALMSDQVGGLHRKHIPASFLNGDLSPQEKMLRYQLVDNGALKFLYCAPERFDPRIVRLAEARRLANMQPSYLVIDEAHCIDRWGDAFRPSYNQLHAVRKSLGNPPVLAFTATAGPRTRKRIKVALGDPQMRTIIQDVDRPNIALLRLNALDEDHRYRITAAFVNAVRASCSGRAIIFAPTKKIGTAISKGLAGLGVEAPFFHGGLKPNERENLLGRFGHTHQPHLSVMVCTSAFGMGIDIPDIRLVVHWQHSPSLEDYLQEFGRAGRDGGQSLAVLFRGKDDKRLHKWMLEQNLQSANLSERDTAKVFQDKTAALDEINSAVRQNIGCFRASLLKGFGEEYASNKKWALRLLEWTFAERKQSTLNGYCCDGCLKPGTDKAEWAKAIIKEMPISQAVEHL